jgi:hypothetical protein
MLREAGGRPGHLGDMTVLKPAVNATRNCDIVCKKTLERLADRIGEIVCPNPSKITLQPAATRL